MHGAWIADCNLHLALVVNIDTVDNAGSGVQSNQEVNPGGRLQSGWQRGYRCQGYMEQGRLPP